MVVLPVAGRLAEGVIGLLGGIRRAVGRNSAAYCADTGAQQLAEHAVLFRPAGCGLRGVFVHRASFRIGMKDGYYVAKQPRILLRSFVRLDAIQHSQVILIDPVAELFDQIAHIGQRAGNVLFVYEISIDDFDASASFHKFRSDLKVEVLPDIVSEVYLEHRKMPVDVVIPIE